MLHRYIIANKKYMSSTLLFGYKFCLESSGSKPYIVTSSVTFTEYYRLGRGGGGGGKA